MPDLQGYIFYSLQHFATKLRNFSKRGMLFQAMAIFLPISIFFKILSERGKVQCVKLIYKIIVADYSCEPKDQLSPTHSSCSDPYVRTLQAATARCETETFSATLRKNFFGYYYTIKLFSYTPYLIISMTKLLDADWLRRVQIFCELYIFSDQSFTRN